MQRLAGLLLVVFCAALVQVQPVEGLAKAKTCDCCKVPGACEMPGCCPSPAALPATLSAEQSARVASLPAGRQAPPFRGGEKFYASFVEPAAVRPALLASAEAAPAAHVPLFKAHCRFLI